MPASAWSPAHPLVKRVLAQPHEFEFLQLLHLIMRLAPERVAIGRQGPPRQEAVALRPSLSLAFPVADIESAGWREDAATPRGQLHLTTTFLGLYGSDSPLPTHFTEALLPEQPDDELVRGFLDLFHHRLLSLLFRVWEKYRYYVTLRPTADDPISFALRGLSGVATTDTLERLGVPPLRLFRYAGLLNQRPRSAVGLEGLLSDYFGGAPCAVISCVGRWLPLSPGQQNRLGRANCGLGAEPAPGHPPGVLLLGERKHDRSGKFRIRIGPVGLREFEQFIPGQPGAEELRRIVSYFLSDPLLFEVEVILRGEEVPEQQFAERGVIGRLGWSSWSKSRPCPDKSVLFEYARAV